MKKSNEIFKDIKKRLIIACKAQNINVEDVYKEIDVTDKELEDFSIMDIVHLAEYLSVSVDYLLGVKEIDKTTYLSSYKNQTVRVEILTEIANETVKKLTKERNILAQMKK